MDLKYKDGEDASIYINNFQWFLNQLLLINLELVNEIQTLIILILLSDIWETLVVLRNNSTSNGKLTMKTIKDNILNEDKRRKGASTFKYHVFVIKS